MTAALMFVPRQVKSEVEIPRYEITQKQYELAASELAGLPPEGQRNWEQAYRAQFLRIVMLEHLGEHPDADAEPILLVPGARFGINGFQYACAMLEFYNIPIESDRNSREEGRFHFLCSVTSAFESDHDCDG